MNKLEIRVFAKVFVGGSNTETFAEILDYRALDILEETEFIFDWTREATTGNYVKVLKLSNSGRVEGIISFRIDRENQAMYVSLVEVAKRNRTSNGKIKGIMQALFAYVAKIGIDTGNDAIFFMSKFQLINHYKETLQAKEYLIRNRLIIENVDMLHLIRTWLIWEEESFNG